MGEQPTKRMVAAEKKYARANDVVEIEHLGVLSSDKSHIEEAFVQHYKKLFSCSAPPLSGFKDDFLPLLPKVDGNDKDFLEEPISLSEVTKAIDDLKPGKSPGPDGLIAGFYKTFKHEISSVLLEVFTEVRTWLS